MSNLVLKVSGPIWHHDPPGTPIPSAVRVVNGSKFHEYSVINEDTGKTILTTQEQRPIDLFPNGLIVLYQNIGETILVFFYDDSNDALKLLGKYSMAYTFWLDNQEVFALKEHSMWYTFDESTKTLVKNLEVLKLAKHFALTR